MPARKSLTALKKAAADCRGCELYKNATQTVFGQGPAGAKVIFIGEQPGDQEDQQGKPFVGPAGRLLDETLEQVGMDRRQVYVTNAVKHFKWVARGKRRLHAKPSARELGACWPWLQAELAAIDPELIVCLGATAAQALLGAVSALLGSEAKSPPSDLAGQILATYHPSAICGVRRRRSRENATGIHGRFANCGQYATSLNGTRCMLREPGTVIPFAKLLDHFAIEGRNIVRFATGYHTAIDDHFGVGPLGTGILEISAD